VFFTQAQIPNSRIDLNQTLHIDSHGRSSNIFNMTSKLVWFVDFGGVGCEIWPLPLPLVLAYKTAYCATTHMREEQTRL